MLDYAWLGIVVQFIDENKKDVKHVIESLDNEGKTEDNIKPFANRYYADKYGKTTAGVILTIDMKGRAIDFRTKGDAMYYFGDGRVNTQIW